MPPSRLCHRLGILGFVALALAPGPGCQRPDALVLCHNANCIEPANPFDDDKLPIMIESLNRTYEGRPLLDGVEFDIFWHAAANDGDGRCILAHDLESEVDTDALAAARVLADYIEHNEVLSWNGERFYVRMELKGHVGPSYFNDKHTPEQARRHAECAIDLFEILDAAAIRSGQRLEIIFDSFAPAVLDALLETSRWPGRQPNQMVQVRLSADFLDSTPSGLALQRLSEFPPVDDVVFHAGWITDGHYQAFRSMDLDLTLWMFSATVETFDAIERFEPRSVLTSEAELMRRWLAY